MKKLPIGIQNICEILEEDYVYVDKTGFAKELIENGKHYFMSRPRRFGKSLFLSTLEEIFKGNRKLFKNCQIYKSNYNWQKYPVVYLDFAQILTTTPEQFEIGLRESLEDIAKIHGLSISGASSQSQLRRLIMELSQENRVAVLVDEYDQPIINHLKNLEIAEKNRDLLKNFFGTLKSLDRYLKFTFVTGVSKFSQVSLFSGPNNLTDITMEPEFAEMMGYTEEEVRTFFKEHIEAIAKMEQLSKEQILEEIRRWYNGYRFTEKKSSVYNPYSTLRFLRAEKAESYWYSTGTPSFLIEQIKKHPQSIVPLRGVTTLKSILLDISKLDRIHLPALMFQTGYLTIQDYHAEENSYRLDFPNEEVRQAFFNSLLQEFTEIDPLDIGRGAEEIKEDLQYLKLESFINKMNVHFAKIPYQLFSDSNEGFYQAVFFIFLEKSGIKTNAEIATNIGRIDLIAEHPKVVYLFELKLDKTAEIAFSQAEAKKYRERYSQDSKDILVVGINFSSASRNISDWRGALFSPSGQKIRDFFPSSS